MKKKDVSFQDMQSTSKAFKGYLGVDIPAGTIANNIILAQATRHAIVHNGGVADWQCIRQLRDASPRDVKPKLAQNERLEFSPTEVETIAASMAQFVDTICGRLGGTT